jgi:excisionase family DNA binding protein
MKLTELLQNQTLVVINSNDLHDFAEKLISDRPSPTIETSQVTEKPLSTKEAADFLGVSRQTLYDLRKKDKLKAHALGGKVYYFRQDLLDALKRS